jgi:hypothetical protein
MANSRMEIFLAIRDDLNMKTSATVQVAREVMQRVHERVQELIEIEQDMMRQGYPETLVAYRDTFDDATMSRIHYTVDLLNDYMRFIQRHPMMSNGIRLLSLIKYHVDVMLQLLVRL